MNYHKLVINFKDGRKQLFILSELDDISFLNIDGNVIMSMGVSNTKPAKKEEDSVEESETEKPKKKGRPRKHEEYYTEGEFDKKKWNSLNKEKVKKHANKMVICECGVEIRNVNKARHEKSPQHIKKVTFNDNI